MTERTTGTRRDYYPRWEERQRVPPEGGSPRRGFGVAPWIVYARSVKSCVQVLLLSWQHQQKHEDDKVAPAVLSASTRTRRQRGGIKHELVPDEHRIGSKDKAFITGKRYRELLALYGCPNIEAVIGHVAA